MFKHFIDPVAFTAIGYIACYTTERVRRVRHVYKAGKHVMTEGKEDAQVHDISSYTTDA